MTNALATSTHDRNSHDERRLTTRWAKPAPEALTIAMLPPGTLFRIVTDLEALKEAFADRIAALDVPLTEIDEAGGMTRGNMQKLLSDSGAKWAREFGWKSLGKALQGTGLALAVIIDDERFSSIKAQMQKRKLRQQRCPAA